MGDLKGEHRDLLMVTKSDAAIPSRQVSPVSLGLVFEKGSHCNPGWPGTHYSYQAGLQVAEVCSPLTPVSSKGHTSNYTIHHCISMPLTRFQVAEARGTYTLSV